MKLVLLAGSLVFWCALHSALLLPAVTAYFAARLGPRFRFYRLAYNTVAAVTLVPVVLLAVAVRTPPRFDWSGGWRGLQVAMLAVSAIFFVLGMRRYDLGQLAGWQQLRSRVLGQGMTASGGLETGGVLAVVRHPMYFATSLLIWARPLDSSALVVNSVLSLYLVVGTHLEERRLVAEFGEAYRAYQRRVPMLLPYRWPRG